MISRRMTSSSFVLRPFSPVSTPSSLHLHDDISRISYAHLHRFLTEDVGQDAKDAENARNYAHSAGTLFVAKPGGKLSQSIWSSLSPQNSHYSISIFSSTKAINFSYLKSTIENPVSLISSWFLADSASRDHRLHSVLLPSHCSLPSHLWLRTDYCLHRAQLLLPGCWCGCDYPADEWL